MLVASVVTMVAFLAWLTVARLPWFTGVVLVALTLVAVASITLAAVQPRAVVEARLLLFLGVAATLLVAGEMQRRRLGDTGDDDRAGRRWPYRIAVGLALFVALGCIPVAAWDFNDEGFVPAVQELGRLPDGLAVRSAGGYSECGTGRCAVAYPLVGRADESAEQVSRRMWKHLVSNGWPAPDAGRSCRPAGWLLDTRETCVEISTAEDGARLTLEGGRPFPRYAHARSQEVSRLR
ncbi:hypothetical protein GCM10010169_22410 [Micromonospora fulviviridis]|uniref:hypothetical protein n=1 Tax=Micromonospora fulviviridis TaxID=47860 RepID=UPI0016686191|nr:hypothetical protein [Micromonospora fulviviridis]GGR77651.1 hypothetical protein GCM10010169_22410 [Micromonospora fulviviridis]